MTMDDRPAAENTPDADDESWPFGFITILILVLLYLGWRLVQAIGWVLDQVCGCV
jgi:hypothetical protein